MRINNISNQFGSMLSSAIDLMLVEQSHYSYFRFDVELANVINHGFQEVNTFSHYL